MKTNFGVPNHVEDHHRACLLALGHDPEEFSFDRQAAILKNTISGFECPGTSDAEGADFEEHKLQWWASTEHDLAICKDVIASKYENPTIAMIFFRARECINAACRNLPSDLPQGWKEFKVASNLDFSVNAFVARVEDRRATITLNGKTFPLVWVNSGVFDFVLTLNRALWVAALGQRDVDRATALESANYGDIFHNLFAGAFPEGMTPFHELIASIMERARNSKTVAIYRPVRSSREVKDLHYGSAIKIADLVTQSAVTFVIAHEYVHLLTGDSGFAPILETGGRGKSPSHRSESTADVYALYAVLYGMGVESNLELAEQVEPEISCLGPYLFLQTLSLLTDSIGRMKKADEIKGFRESASHPSLLHRKLQLLADAIQMLRSGKLESTAILRLIRAASHFDLALALAIAHAEYAEQQVCAARQNLKIMSQGLQMDLSSVNL